MNKVVLSEGVTRVVLKPEDAEGFEPVAFADAAGTFLILTGFSCAERPVYRLEPEAGEGNIRQTANGEVVVFDDGECRKVRMRRGDPDRTRTARERDL